MCVQVFSWLHMLALLCVCVCMSTESVCAHVKHPERQRGTELECVCVRECVYASQRCVTLTNESLRSPAVQG